MRTLLLRLSRRRALGEAIARLPGGRRLVRRFVAGPTADDALEVIARLNRGGLLAAVTYLGENVQDAADADRAAGAYVELLDELERRGLRAVPSLKLTHLGLDLGVSICEANLNRVLERGRATGTLVWIDMESSAYTDRTLDLYARVRSHSPTTACVVQAYLHRTERDLERLIDLGATVRLCKGAYREPPPLAYPRKRDVDRAYRRLLDRLFAPDAQAKSVYVGVATHDLSLQRYARASAGRCRIGPDRFEIQMLYGIRPEVHRHLLAHGLRVRVLVPFGEDWFGYFMRRLAERPANLLFLLRHLTRGGAPPI